MRPNVTRCVATPSWALLALGTCLVVGGAGSADERMPAGTIATHGRIPTWTLTDGGIVVGTPLALRLDGVLLQRFTEGPLLVPRKFFTRADAQRVLTLLPPDPGFVPSPKPDDREAVFTSLFPEQEELELMSIGQVGGPADPVKQTALSGNGQRMIVAFEDGRTEIWRTKPVEKLASLTAARGTKREPMDNSPHVGLTFDGKQAVIGWSREQRIELWNVETQNKTTEWTDVAFVGLTMVPDGSAVVARDMRRMTRIDVIDGTRTSATVDENGTDHVSLVGPGGWSYVVGPPGNNRGVEIDRFGEADDNTWRRVEGERIKGCPLSACNHQIGAVHQSQADYLFVFELPQEIYTGAATAPTLSFVESYSTYQTKLNQVQGLWTSKEGTWLAIKSAQWLRFSSWASPQYGRNYKLPEALRTGDVAFDGRLQIFTAQTGDAAAVWEATGYQAHPRIRLATAVQSWLSQGQFETLDALYAWLERHPEHLYGDWKSDPHDGLLNEMMLAPVLRGETGRSILTHWIAAKPDTIWARLELADREIKRGWAARGGGYASTVTEEGWQTFRDTHATAYEVLEPLIELKSPPASLYKWLLTIARDMSFESDETSAIIRSLLEHHPTYVDAHLIAITNYLPRWGGEAGLPGKYIDRVALRVEEKDGKTAGDIIYTRLCNAIDSYSGDEIFTEGHCDQPRFLRGALALLDQKINDTKSFSQAMLVAHILKDEAARLKLKAALEAAKTQDVELLTPYMRSMPAYDWLMSDGGKPTAPQPKAMRPVMPAPRGLAGEAELAVPVQKRFEDLYNEGVVLFKKTISGGSLTNHWEFKQPLFSPDGRRLYTTGLDPKINGDDRNSFDAWDTGTAEKVWSHGAITVSRSAISPDGTTLAVLHGRVKPRKADEIRVEFEHVIMFLSAETGETVGQTDVLSEPNITNYLFNFTTKNQLVVGNHHYTYVFSMDGKSIYGPPFLYHAPDQKYAQYDRLLVPASSPPMIFANKTAKSLPGLTLLPDPSKPPRVDGETRPLPEGKLLDPALNNWLDGGISPDLMAILRKNSRFRTGLAELTISTAPTASAGVGQIDPGKVLARVMIEVPNDSSDVLTAEGASQVTIEGQGRWVVVNGRGESLFVTVERPVSPIQLSHPKGTVRFNPHDLSCLIVSQEQATFYRLKVPVEELLHSDEPSRD